MGVKGKVIYYFILKSKHCRANWGSGERHACNAACSRKFEFDELVQSCQCYERLWQKKASAVVILGM